MSKMPCKCISCESIKIHKYFSQGEEEFFKCNQCHLVWRHPIPNEVELDLIYSKAYAQENVENGITNQESGSYAASKYANYLSKRDLLDKSYILDYGAATGEMVSCLRDLNFSVDGYEYSENACEYSKLNRNINLFRTELEIPKLKYSLITMIEVIEHLRNPGNTLSELKNYLVNGGCLFITTPNRRGWRAIIESVNWREAKKKFHLYLFSEESLKELLLRNGFHNVRRIRFSPITRPGIKFWLWGRLMQILGLGGTLCVIASKVDK